MSTPRFRRATPRRSRLQAHRKLPRPWLDLVPGSASVWQVVAPPAPALVTLPGGFAKPKADSSGVGVGFAFTSPSGVGVLDFTAKAAGVVRVVFDAVPPQGAARTLRIADSQASSRSRSRGERPSRSSSQIPRGRVSAAAQDRPGPDLRRGRHRPDRTPRAERASGSAHCMRISSHRSGFVSSVRKDLVLVAEQTCERSCPADECDLDEHVAREPRQLRGLTRRIRVARRALGRARAGTRRASASGRRSGTCPRRRARRARRA